MAPRGTEVRAADDGTIAKLFTSKAGGLTIYQFDSSETFSSILRAPRQLHNCLEHAGGPPQPLSALSAAPATHQPAPHLHFAVFRLGPERKWWKGAAVNPYPAFSQ